MYRIAEQLEYGGCSTAMLKAIQESIKSSFMDIDEISKIGYAMASAERDRNNKQYGVNNRHHINKSELPKMAARYTLVLICLLTVIKFFAKIIEDLCKRTLNAFGTTMGSIVISIAVGIFVLCCFFSHWIPFYVSTVCFIWAAFKIFESRMGSWFNEKCGIKVTIGIIIAICSFVPCIALVFALSYHDNTDTSPSKSATQIAQERNAIRQSGRAYYDNMKNRFDALKKDFCCQAEIFGQDPTEVRRIAKNAEKEFIERAGITHSSWGSVNDAKLSIDNAYETCTKMFKECDWYDAENERIIADYKNKALARLSNIVAHATKILKQGGHIEKLGMIEYQENRFIAQLKNYPTDGDLPSTKEFIDKNLKDAIANINKAIGEDVEILSTQDGDPTANEKEPACNSSIPTSNEIITAPVQQNHLPQTPQLTLGDAKQYLKDKTFAIKHLADEIKHDVSSSDYYMTIKADYLLEKYDDESRLNGFVQCKTYEEAKARIDKAYDKYVNALSNGWKQVKGK